MGKVFKTAVFGGFRKKDVVDYLEVVGREKRIDTVRHDEELSRLEQRNRELADQVAQVKKELDERVGSAARTARQRDEELAVKSREWAVRERELLESLDAQRRQNAEQLARLNEDLRAGQAERDDLLEKLAALETVLAGRRETAPPAFTMPRREDLTEGADAAANRRLLADMKERLIEVVEEINRLMDPGEVEDSSAEREKTAPTPEKSVTKLQSVNDILFYVRAKGDRR